MSDLSIQVVRDGRELAAWEEPWWDLWRRSPGATPFQSPAWLLAWQRQFAPSDLRSVLALQSGRLVGLFPFYCEQGVRLLPIGISLSDYLDVLLDPELGVSQTLTALMSEVDCEQWSFEELPPGAIALDLPLPSDRAESLDIQSACPVLELRGGSDLSGCVPTRKRRQLRRAWAIAERMGQVRVAQERDSEAFLETLFFLHASRWRSRDEAGVLGDPEVREFHHAALRALAAAGLARCHILTIGGRVVAAYYGFCDRGRAFAYIGGFDPDFEEASPGAILIGHAIGQAIAEGANEFHFLRGREAYKYSWGASDRWNRRRVWSKRDAGG
jgi:CelD/BcsL family acetyltransferase involved in cellulose biosynthesis